MNETQPLECICLPNEWSISISILGILIPLFVSEILPFCTCQPNGIFHGIFLKCQNNKVVPSSPSKKTIF